MDEELRLCHSIFKELHLSQRKKAMCCPVYQWSYTRQTMTRMPPMQHLLPRAIDGLITFLQHMDLNKPNLFSIKRWPYISINNLVNSVFHARVRIVIQVRVLCRQGKKFVCNVQFQLWWGIQFDRLCFFCDFLSTRPRPAFRSSKNIAGASF